MNYCCDDNDGHGAGRKPLCIQMEVAGPSAYYTWCPCEYLATYMVRSQVESVEYTYLQTIARVPSPCRDVS